jgi:hypothetical protein
MAGGYMGKKDPKNNKFKDTYNEEVLKDSQPNYSQKAPVKFSLNGILGLGQKVEINKATNTSKEIFSGISHLQHEQSVLFDHKQKELENTIKELREEIGKLAKVTDNLEKDVQNVAIEEIVDANDYQIKFFERIRNFISSMRKNISEASVWLESFTAKKKKKNAFWNKAKDKKKGGTKYMFSDEHSAARSID